MGFLIRSLVGIVLALHFALPPSMAHAQSPTALPALTVTPDKGSSGQKISTTFYLTIQLGLADLLPKIGSIGVEGLQKALHQAVAQWKCDNPANYKVSIPEKVQFQPVKEVQLTRSGGCDVTFSESGDVPEINLIVADNNFIFLKGKPKVALQHLPRIHFELKGKEFTLSMKPGKNGAEPILEIVTPKPGGPSEKTEVRLGGDSKDEVQWYPEILTISAQSILNEKLIDSSVFTKGVLQFGVSGTQPVYSTKWGGWLLETKNLFSTNERDTKSAFKGGGGAQVGLSTKRYIPLKIEQLVQGNQIATNLSTVSLMELTTLVPWGGVIKGTQDLYVRSPVPPAFTLDIPYTHRINQFVLPGKKPLPTNDFALNPALAFTGGQFFEQYCNREGTHQERSGPCLNWDANVGLWFLPLEKTVNGSRRAEGYWDASLLFPFSNLVGIVKADQQTKLLQLRVKYEDSVNAANNYVRTKKWSFGVEFAKK